MFRGAYTALPKGPHGDRIHAEPRDLIFHFLNTVDFESFRHGPVGLSVLPANRKPPAFEDRGAVCDRINYARGHAPRI